MENTEKKFSFKIGVQAKKSAVLERTKFVADKDDEKDDDDEMGEKRNIVLLEDGVAKLSNGKAAAKESKKEYIILRPIDRLKKLVDDGLASDEEKARLALLMEASGEVPKTLPTQQSSMANLIKIEETTAGDDVNPDYDAVPITEFGLAYLRGFGWREGQCIGRTNVRIVPLKIPEPRPKGLGLGATISSEQNSKNNGKKSALKVNIRVIITNGAERGRCGVIRSMDEDNASCFIELDVSARMVRASQYNLEVLKTETNGRSSPATTLPSTSKGSSPPPLPKKYGYESMNKESRAIKREHPAEIQRFESSQKNGRESSPKKRHRDTERRSHRERHSSSDDESHRRSKKKSHKKHRR